MSIIRSVIPIYFLLCTASVYAVDAIPGRIQAENYVNYSDTTPGNAGTKFRADNVDIQTTTDLGGGYNVGWIAGGEWLEYAINVTQAGTYQLDARVASLPGSGAFTLQIGGSTLGNSLTVNATGGWQNWTNVSTNIGALTAGNKTLRIQVQSGNFNINWLELKKVGGATLGKFNPSKDLFLAHFDTKPDVDDIHSMAATGTMLKDARFSNVKYYAVTGAVGVQGGNFTDASAVMNLAFPGHWASAAKDWQGAVNTEAALAISTLKGGGDIWIMEAGQSDFSADLIRKIKTDYLTANTGSQIHIVQHGTWNEDKTTPADFSYVKQNTDYQKIADGNATGNGTPGFSTSDGSRWNAVVGNAEVGSLWKAARSLANARNGSSISGHENKNIRSGGFDFSDTSEATWIFGFNSLYDSKAFFNEFLH